MMVERRAKKRQKRPIYSKECNENGVFLHKWLSLCVMTNNLGCEIFGYDLTHQAFCKQYLTTKKRRIYLKTKKHSKIH